MLSRYLLIEMHIIFRTIKPFHFVSNDLICVNIWIDVIVIEIGIYSGILLIIPPVWEPTNVLYESMYFGPTGYVHISGGNLIISVLITQVPLYAHRWRMWLIVKVKVMVYSMVLCIEHRAPDLTFYLATVGVLGLKSNHKLRYCPQLLIYTAGWKEAVEIECLGKLLICTNMAANIGEISVSFKLYYPYTCKDKITYYMLCVLILTPSTY